MNPKIKNIIIFSAIAIVLILVYFFFFKSSPQDQSLLSSSGGSDPTAVDTTAQGTAVGSDFISLLLNVKSIKLDYSIFTDPGFLSLKDSSITLTQDGTEGRRNPFAPIGIEVEPTTSSSGVTEEGIIEAVAPSGESIAPALPTAPASTQPGSKTGTKKK